MDHFNGLFGHEGLSHDKEGFSDLERRALKIDELGKDFFMVASNWDRPDQEQAAATIKAWSNFESFA